MMKFLKILKVAGLVLLIGCAVYLIFLKGDKKQNEVKEDTASPASEEDENKQSNFLDDKGEYSFKNESLIVSVELPENIKDISDFGNEQIERFVSSKDEISEIDSESFPWNLDMTYTKHESDTIVSYIVQGYEFTGGAHGNTFLESFNYDKKTGARINVQDVVTNEDTFNILAAFANNELTVEYPEGSNANPENWSVWYTNNSSITFIFVPYQIASYATGQQELQVETTGENASLFKQEYFK